MDPRLLFTLDAIQPWLEAHGFVPRDAGLLAAALDRPWSTFGGVELYKTPFDKAAALIDSVESSHPLLDGSKRLGVLLGSLMLRVYGVRDLAISDDEWFDLILDVAKNHPPVPDVSACLRQLVEGGQGA